MIVFLDLVFLDLGLDPTANTDPIIPYEARDGDHFTLDFRYQYYCTIK